MHAFVPPHPGAGGGGDLLGADIGFANRRAGAGDPDLVPGRLSFIGCGRAKRIYLPVPELLGVDAAGTEKGRPRLWPRADDPDDAPGADLSEHRAWHAGDHGADRRQRGSG